MEFVGTARLLPLAKSQAASLIHNCGAFNNAERRALLKALRLQPFSVIQNANSTANNSATLVDSTDLKVTLRAGQQYQIDAWVSATNAVGTDGLKLGFAMTGTQTNALVYGSSDIYGTNVTTTSASISLSSGAYSVSDADSSAMSLRLMMVLIPQSDCTFSIQHAEAANAGAGGSVLLKGSWVRILELN